MNSESNIYVREYRHGDFDQVESLWELTGLHNKARGDDEAVVEESIRMGGCLLVLENAETVIIGTSWMTYDGRRIHLHHFAIHPRFQGKKLSKLLLEHSLSFARRRGKQVKLEVSRDNLKAISLYKNAGFKLLGDYDVYIIRDIAKNSPGQ